MIYIPPENSAYSKISMFDNMDEIITDLRIKYNNIDVCIMGDLNARTGNASDVLEMGQDEIELIDGYVPLENINILENRVSFDNTVNNYGTRLLTLCKSLYMFIVNGRIGKDAQVGRPACKNVSVVDYVICTTYMFSTIVNFEVDDFNHMLSDVHSASRWDGKYTVVRTRIMPLHRLM